MLLNNERFRNEYKMFEETISSVSNEKIRNEMQNLLKELLEEVKKLDRHHEELFKGSRLATDAVSTHRSNLSEIRQKISKKIDYCKKNKMIIK